MSLRFKRFSSFLAISNILIGAVFFTAHPSMNSPSWQYVFILIPWQVWCIAFFGIGFAMCLAIGGGDSRQVRKVACFSFMAKLLWATEFAFLLPAVVAGHSVSWMGFVLVGTMAAYELVYLGMPASRKLDLVLEGEYQGIMAPRK